MFGFEPKEEVSITSLPTIFMKIYNIVILSTIVIGLAVSFFHGMLAGAAVNLALFLIVKKFSPEQ